jgi:hypothetical protein
LDQELRDRLLAIADEKAAKIGVDGLHEFVDQARTVFEKLAQYLEPMRTRDGLIAALDSLELTPEEERMAVAFAEHFGHFMREAVTTLIDLGIKELPPVPSGRRRVLTADLAQEINAYVLDLYGTNLELKKCKKRAAQRFGVSYTTVQRAWSSRSKVNSGSIDAGSFVEYIRRKLSNEWITANTNVMKLAKSEYRAIEEASHPHASKAQA